MHVVLLKLDVLPLYLRCVCVCVCMYGGHFKASWMLCRNALIGPVCQDVTKLCSVRSAGVVKFV